MENSVPNHVTDSLDPHEVAAEALVLLVQALNEAYDLTKKDELRSSFIYRHARNISDLADDFLELDAMNRTSGARILIRPMLESLFRLIAAVKDEKFAAEKLIAELEDEVERIRKWDEVDKEFGASMTDVVSQLAAFAEQLRSTHRISTHQRWNVYDTARLADMGSNYIKEYFLFSKYTHATISGIISQEYVIGRPQSLQTAIFVMLAATGHLVQVVETKSPQAHLDRATALMKRTTDLIESGAFKSVEADGGKSK